MKHSILPLIFILFFASSKNTLAQNQIDENNFIYELNTRQFTEEGTFASAIEFIPTLKEFGINIIKLMPIQPIGVVNRKGTLGNYYSIKDYYKINPEYGTAKELKELINICHESDLRVVLDWSANHSSWDNGLTITNPEFYKIDDNENFIPPLPEMDDVIEFDDQNSEFRKYMANVLNYWISEFKIDGFCFEAASLMSDEFWNKLREELIKETPIIMISDSDEVDENNFDFIYNLKLYKALDGINKGKINNLTLRNVVNMTSSKSINFISNHELNSWQGSALKRFKNNYELMNAIIMLLPGNAMFYTGQIENNNKQLPYYDKGIINRKSISYNKIITTLGKLKESLKGKETEFIQISNSQNENVLSILLLNETQTILAVLNLSNENKSVLVNNKLITGNYKNIFTNTHTSILNKVSFDLEAWEYKILFVLN